MKFSIIIPVYNVEKYLRDCLNSVISQSFTDWEAICVDDGSTDTSLTILKEYEEKDDRVNVIHKENKGLSSARNEGIKLAEGEYLIFLDSDDWLSNRMLEVIANEEHGEDLICFSGIKYFESSNTYSPREHLSPADNISGMEYFDKYSMELKELHFDCAVSRAYRREYLLDSELWFKEGRLHEDFLFTPQACWYAKRVKVIDESLYYYRIRPGSITTSSNIKGLFDYIKSNNELASFFKSKNCDKSVIYRRLTQSYQIFILRSDKETDRIVNNLIDWELYKLVSRDRFSHKINFAIANLSLAAYRNFVFFRDKQ